MPNFTLFLNFADSCLQNDPLFVDFANSRLPLKKYPFFRENGYERGIHRRPCLVWGNKPLPHDDLKNAFLVTDLLRCESTGHRWISWQRIRNASLGVFFGVSIKHYGDVIMSLIGSQITSLTIVYSSVYSDADQWKHQSSAPLAFVWGIHRGPVNSPHKWPVTRKMFPFDDVIMNQSICWWFGTQWPWSL